MRRRHFGFIYQTVLAGALISGRRNSKVFISNLRLASASRASEALSTEIIILISLLIKL